ncbi:MAG: DNA translocase FtsK [Parcubacteria group bacterium]
MGRSKKVKEEDEKEKTSFKFDIASDVKRSAAAIFLFALALVIALGFFGKAGVIGLFLDNSIGMLIGWAKIIFPLFLLAAGIVLLLRHKTSFYVAKLTGLAVALIGAAGFFHWFFEIEKMIEAAKAGSGGGYIGYVVAYLAVKFLGNAGGLVLILALFLIGFTIAFNVSLANLFAKIFRKNGEEAGAEKPVEFVEEVQNEEAEKKAELIMPAATGSDLKKAESAADQDSNIGKIEFVEGPDQFVDEKFLSGLQHKSFDVKNGLEEKVFAKKRKSFGTGSGKNSQWILPPLDLLEGRSGKGLGGDIDRNAEIIQKTLHNFGIEVERDEIKTGPSVTQYRFRPAVGVKVASILALQNDISLALAAHPLRIEAPIPGKALIGIEVPNKVTALVRLRDFIEDPEFVNRQSNLTLSVGEDVAGNFIFSNLETMPHLLIAGSTGKGKSVAINSIIATLLYQNSPKDLKFIMVDPKRVELSLYNGIPHLLTDVITENGKVISALRWVVREMEKRYRLLQDMGAQNINSYNEKFEKGQKRKYTNPETGVIEEQDIDKLPFIVVVVDELAELMMSHGKEVEGAIVRIAQMARAVGIHLIVSTQRPEVKVITGLIKANITTRIAFQVATQIDSRTIIDMAGAEKLLGNGDMLYMSTDTSKPKRIQGIFVSESEVKRVVKFINSQKKKLGEESIGEDITSPAQGGALEFKNMDENKDEDDLYEAAKVEVTRAGKASATLLQRRLRIGYARAARLLDVLEDNGIIGPGDGAKPREVYASKDNIENATNYERPIEDQVERDKWQA